jgi:hypothetical protein
MDYSTTLEIPVLVGSQEVFTLKKDTITDAGKTYKGAAQKATFTFSVLNTTLSSVNDWIANRSVNDMIDAFAAEGSDVLALKVWVGDSSVWRLTVNYKVEITVTKPAGMAQGGMASLQLVWWGMAAIVVGVAALAYWLVVRPLLTQVTDLVYGPANTDGTRIPWYQSLFLPAAILGGIYLLTQGTKSSNTTKKKA